LKLEPNYWYRFKIILDGPKIQIYCQKGLRRRYIKLFDFDDDVIQRGTIGLAVNNNTMTYFDGI